MKLTNAIRSGIAIPLFFGGKLCVGLAIIKLSAHFLDITGFGVFSQLFLFASFANLLAAGGIQNGLTREVAIAKNVLEQRQAIRAAAWISGTVSLSAVALTVVFAHWISVLLSGHGGLGVVAVALVSAAALGGIGQVWCAVLTGQGLGDASLTAQGAGLLIGGGGAIIALFEGQGILAVIFFGLGPVVTSLVAWLLLTPALRNLRSPIGARSNHVARLLSYSGSFIVTASLMPMTLFAFRYAYRHSFGTEDIAFWLAANRVSDVTTQLLALFMTQILLPTVSAASSLWEVRRFIIRVFLLGTLLMSVLLGVFWLGSREVIQIFLSARYLAATPFILIYMTGDVVRVSGSIGLFTALARRRLRAYVGLEVLFATAFAAATALLMRGGFSLAPALGYLACNVMVALAAWLFRFAFMGAAQCETERSMVVRPAF